MCQHTQRGMCMACGIGRALRSQACQQAHDRGRAAAPQTAIEAGEFLEDPGDCESGPCLPAVIGIAADIAAGMAFLHGRKILHGDLTCSALALPTCLVQ